MVDLDIDIHNNVVYVKLPSGGREHFQFSRRWEASLLAALLKEGKHRGSLEAGAFQAILKKQGQSTALNRAQMLRLLDAVDAFLGKLPEAVAHIESAPRKRTVGPWRLLLEANVCLVGEEAVQEDTWPHVSLLPDNKPMALHTLLSSLLIADALAVEGQYPAALSALQDLDMGDLSSEAQGLVGLRRCGWYRPWACLHKRALQLLK